MSIEQVTSDERIYWLAFSAFSGIGPLRFKLLREYFGNAKRAWNVSLPELKSTGLGDRLSERFICFRDKFSLTDYVSNLSAKNIRYLILTDKEYPGLLKEIPDAPFVIYLRGYGNLDFNDSVNIAVVGTRKITSYGREITEKVTSGLVSAGITVVSGMAYGADTVAHRTAIDTGGKTIAVLGCGVDIIHPVTNTGLYREIVDGKGIVLSEFPPGLFATRGMFPSRNRIISGLSLGTVVTEGAIDSGSLITARFAAEQGREVFAVPGPVTSAMSEGPLSLIKSGAKLVTAAQDILEELDIKTGRKIKRESGAVLNLSGDESKIRDLLASENLHMDEIIRKLNSTAPEVGRLLTGLEMKGIIKSNKGFYSLI